MIDEKKYLDIHRGLAEQHPQLRHSERHVAWIGSEVDEESKVGTRDLGRFVMLMRDLNGQFEGDDDSLRDVLMGGFELVAVMEPTTTPDFREKEELRSEAMRIGKQIVLRLLAISRGEANYPNQECSCCLSGMVASSVRYRRVDPRPGWSGYEFSYSLGSNTDMDDEEWD